MVQGCLELLVRDDHGVEADVERTRRGVEGHADDTGQVLELGAGPFGISALLRPNDQEALHAAVPNRFA